MTRKLISTLIVAGAVSGIMYSQVNLTSAMLGSYQARQIGSAEMSGRITAIDVVSTNPRLFYVGTAGGGVWKTTNAGSTFKPVFDKYCQSVGALLIDQKNPETIWVGTGESNMRNSVSVGTGLYVSNDGGSNWKKSGLDSTEHISKIVLDPSNPEIVYVAAPGPLWSDSKHRGLYKSSDKGKTWNKILYSDTRTGCADVIVDPKNPNVIYASMWEFRRTPWSFTSGGKGSGLFKSTDGGKTWKRIQNGFDGQVLGRICLAVSPTETNKLYAIAESKNTALYASTDGGESWTKKSAGMNVTWRPFYFSVIAVDPVDPKRIYRPSLNLSISTDGGESFKEASFEGGWVHSDHHAIWINPNNNSHLLLGTDGGVYQSMDRGNSWTMFKNLPVSQFYHVSVDDQVPYNVYGGLQDNGSWFAPSQSVGGIENKDWTNCAGGDGFWVQPDREDHTIVYAESQGGYIVRYNKKTNESRDIRPFPLAGEPKLRCNWNTPVLTSPNDKRVIYFGAQYLYRSRDKGESWERISPDLTTNNPKKQLQENSGGLSVDNSGAENHCTIFTIEEAPGDPNTIWVGTDDGNLQVTHDGGKTWTNRVANIKGLPMNAWVSSVEVSSFDRNRVFVTFDNHALGDMRTHVYMSADDGQTWAAISTKDLTGFAHKICQDPVNRELLFLGTELGLFMSRDLGKSWIRFQANVPPVAVRDIVIHPITHDLVLATHGRGIIIVDDITPLRAITPEVLNSEMSFLPTRPSFVTSGKYGAAFPNGGYAGSNSSEELVICYYLKDRVMKGDVRVEFYDASGKKIGAVPGSKRRGLNVVSWDMRMKPPRVAKGVKLDFSGFTGPLIPSGEYTVRLIKGEKQIEQKITLGYDPQSYYTAEDRAAQQKLMKEIFEMQENLAFLASQLNKIKDVATSRKNATADKKVVAAADALIRKVDALYQTLVASIEGTNITGEEKLREKISDLYYGVVSFEGKPTRSQYDRFAALQKEYADAKAAAEKIFQSDVKTFNDLLTGRKMEGIVILGREEWDSQSTTK
ncbi:MAG: glycosyl hydrolase [Bacteroidia bacterium]|nr:glycosyl hydrolase [Bacteroidia bacterium]